MFNFYFFKSLSVALISMLSLDFIWLNYVGKRFYLEGIGKLLRLNSNGSIDPNYYAALLVYGALIIGIFSFVIPLAHNSLERFLYGALFGLLVYIIYDFTNLAIVNNWPLKISIIDSLWGMILCAITSFLTGLI